MKPELNIGIAGAGIGGLAAAALLARDGHRVQVFDQFDAPRPIGSGLVIQPVGQMVLHEIDALAAARSKGTLIRRMLGHEADSGRPVLDVWYDRAEIPARFGLAIHRASLFDTILKAAQDAGAELIQSHRVTAIAAGHLHFADGSSTTFNLTIDAMGAGSPATPLTAKPLPYGAIWGTVAWPKTDLPLDQLTQSYRRADRMIGVLPIGSLPGDTTNSAAIFWSLPRDGHNAWRDAPLDHWRDEATALWPDFAPFAAQITDHDQMTMARYSHGTLRKPIAEAHAIIGDAAHRASPQLGQGANMALLDAMALAMALRHAPLDEALPHYAAARRWHTRLYQVMSWAFTPQYQSDSKVLPMIRDRALFPLSQIPPVSGILTKLVCGTLLPPMGSLTR